MGEEWKGGDMANSVGGGQKVLMMRQALESYKDDPEMIILFTDAYDVLFNANRQQILEQFNKFNARVVFSAEGFCWPDAHLASEYIHLYFLQLVQYLICNSFFFSALLS